MTKKVDKNAQCTSVVYKLVATTHFQLTNFYIKIGEILSAENVNQIPNLQQVGIDQSGKIIEV